MLRVQDFGATENKRETFRDTSFANFVRRSHRWIPLGIFAASILVTMTFWRVLPGSLRVNEGTDYFAYYEPLARHLLAGQGLTLGGHPHVSHPPGYPFVLAVVFKVSQAFRIGEERALAAFAALCMALVSILIFHLSRIIWGILSAVISSFLWMTYPFALWLTKQPNSELPFMVVFYGALLLLCYALVRRINAWSLYAICGFLLGIAMLIRPFAIGIGLTMALVVRLVKRDVSKYSRLLLMIALLLGNAVAVLPWEVWAYSHTGKVVLLGTVGVSGICDGLTFGSERKHYREDNNFSPDVNQVMLDFHANLIGAETLSEVLAAIAKEARAHPLGVTKLFLLKVARSWYGTDSQREEGWILVIQLLYLFPLLWTIRRVWRQGELRRRCALSILLIVLYFWGMSVLGTSLLRYMVPVTGLVFVLMSAAVSFVPLRSTRTPELNEDESASQKELPATRKGTADGPSQIISD